MELFNVKRSTKIFVWTMKIIPPSLHAYKTPKQHIVEKIILF